MASTAKRIVDFLASVRLTITLLIILTVISFFGVIIPQELPESQYLHKWGTTAGTVLLTLGVNHVFSALWFYLLLGLFSCNIFVCSMTRLWKNMGNSFRKNFLAQKDVAQCRHSTTIAMNSTAASARDGVTATLSRRGFAVATQPAGEGFQVAARKGTLKDIGSLVFHLSIIVLFIGGFIGSRFGYSEMKNLSSGQITAIAKRSFLLRCDWFKLEQNEDGSPKEYRSKLAILSPEDSSVVLEKIIEVNRPLSYEGIRFYQSSYGLDDKGLEKASVTITGPGLPAGGWSGDLPLDWPVPLSGTGITARIFNYLPDFIIDMETRQAGTRSNNPNNPAVKLLLTRGTDTLHNHWLFFNFPEQHAENEVYKAAVSSSELAYYAGIQVRDNPGVPVIWVGIILMTFGIFTVFYVPKKSVWATIGPQPGAKGGAVITLGGTSNRAPQDFQGEFDKIGAAIKATLKQEA
jgi:cytochrome c biogenesis protein